MIVKHGRSKATRVEADGLGPIGPPVSGARWLDIIGASPAERELVELGVIAVLRMEHEAMEKREVVGQGRKTKKESQADQKLSADHIISTGGIFSFERQIKLLLAVVRVARDRGATFQYQENWRDARRRKAVDHEAEDQALSRAS